MNKFYELQVRQDLRDSKFLLERVVPVYEYKNNVKTENLIGYKYQVLPWEDKSLGEQVIKVLDTELPLGVSVDEPPEDVFLRFDDWFPCTEWYNRQTKKREVSVRAGIVKNIDEKSQKLPTL